MSAHAAELMLQEWKRKKNLLLCAATGNSPRGAYQLFVQALQGDVANAEKMRLLKLDEWGGVSMTHPETCESFLQKNFVTPLNMDPSRYYSFRSNAEDPLKECEWVADRLQSNGPIDLCVLGLGLNGHIAFNEPAGFLHPFCHITPLSYESMQHTMARGMLEKPSYGMTLGMAEIMQSRKILLLVTGNAKKPVFERLLTKEITTWLPASFLWLHGQVHCLVDGMSMG